MNSLLSPITGKDWNRVSARHLLNRAGFGAPHASIEKLAALGPEAAVDQFVNAELTPAIVERPDFVSNDADDREEMRGRQQLDRETRQKLMQEKMREQREAMNQLRIWWLQRMVRTESPLLEKLALFWHGHFATADNKVRSSQLNFDIYRVFRTHGLGYFPQLVAEVSKTPAMLIYLDNNRNRKSEPNENFARELMELFTLGIGNYSERDIHEAARAFTGWTARGGRFQFNRRQHDTSAKILLGRSGNFDGEAAIKVICEQPAMPRFITRKIWEYFTYEKPSDYLVAELAGEFIRQKYQLRPFLRTVFLSHEFYSERALAQQIKSPLQLLVQMLVELQIDLDEVRSRLIETSLRSMGQELFHPPNVKGWEGNRAWINTNTLLVRYNLPAQLLRARAIAEEQSGGDDQLLLSGNGPQDGNMMLRENPRNARGRRGANQKLFDAPQFFGKFEGRTAGQTVDALLDLFIGRPVDKDQHNLLVRTIDPQGDANRVIERRMINDKTLNGTVMLILSTAEYQLC